MFSKHNVVTTLSVLISLIFIQSLFFKFMNAPETQHIFGTIAEWMRVTPFASLSDVFSAYGGYATGTVELVASLLLLNNAKVRMMKQDIAPAERTTFYGAIIAFGVMTGAIFFHLFTPLGVNVQGDGGALFAMAVFTWFSSLYLIYTHHNCRNKTAASMEAM